MDFRSLTYFVTVAHELNFSRAAEKLNMSQPPLSNQIQNLEEELGVKLFVRGYHSLSLTEAGNLFLRRANQILDLSEKTRNDINQLTGGLSGTLFISLVEGKAPFIASNWIAGFHQEYPNVQYELWNGSSDEAIDQLNKGLADIAIIAAPFDFEHLESIYVGSEPWVAMIPESHALANNGKTSVEISELIGEPLIIPRRKSRVEAIHHWFHAVNAEPSVLCEQSNYLDAVALVSAGAGISIFPQTLSFSIGNVLAKPITNPSKNADYYLVWNKEQRLGSIAEEFINFVKDELDASPINTPIPSLADIF